MARALPLGVLFLSTLSACSGGTPAEPPTAFEICATCHSVEPDAHGIGPTLWGIGERPAGSAAGYGYSQVMQEADLTWDKGTLTRFLMNPSEVVPGTKMMFPGYDKQEDAEVVADYILQLK